jgi:predicted  nucleic acid-binding Zn-ribbon protein
MHTEQATMSNIRSNLEREKDMEVLEMKKRLLHEKENQLNELRVEFSKEKEDYMQHMSDKLKHKEEELRLEKERHILEMSNLERNLVNLTSQMEDLKRNIPPPVLKADFCQQFNEDPHMCKAVKELDTIHTIFNDLLQTENKPIQTLSSDLLCNAVTSLVKEQSTKLQSAEDQIHAAYEKLQREVEKRQKYSTEVKALRDSFHRGMEKLTEERKEKMVTYEVWL